MNGAEPIIGKKKYPYLSDTVLSSSSLNLISSSLSSKKDAVEKKDMNCLLYREETN